MKKPAASAPKKALCFYKGVPHRHCMDTIIAEKYM